MILQMLLLGIEYDVATREIISKSKDLIIKSGLSNTSMQDIAIACKKDKSFINKYFKNKSTLIDAVFEKELRVLNEKVSVKVDKEKGFFKKINTYCKEFSNEFIKINRLYEVTRKEAYNKYDYEKYLLKINQNEVNYINGLVSYGKETGELKSISKDASEMFVNLFLGSLMYSIHIHSEYEQKYVEIIIKHVVHKVF